MSMNLNAGGSKSSLSIKGVNNSSLGVNNIHNSSLVGGGNGLPSSRERTSTFSPRSVEETSKSLTSTVNQLLSTSQPSTNAIVVGSSAVSDALLMNRNSQSAKTPHAPMATTDYLAQMKLTEYWKQPPLHTSDDLVVIHVCDENRGLVRDFYCKRDILIKRMKYFEKFLSENENGYDDIDISVHCDAEIFEWLMTFIHEPDRPPILEKAIVVSILISSEFLQMDSLVEICLEHISQSLNEIIKLPIDLSCISEKLVNKLASITHPKVLAQTKDRKDKILHKLYKRRVELDFSRKSGSKGGIRTIAASLTCCRFCGCIYLENCSAMLTCRNSPPSIDFRGELCRRHYSINGWSLTVYLKTLHAGGMGWDAIYWHVWGACEVFKVEDIMISALEVDSYSVEPDGIVLRRRPNRDEDNEDRTSTTSISGQAKVNQGTLQAPPINFFLNSEGVGSSYAEGRKILVTPSEDIIYASVAHITPSLNPNRPPEILSKEVFELMSSQLKLISGKDHKKLIETTRQATVMAASVSSKDICNPIVPFDFSEVLWGDVDPSGDRGDEDEGTRLRGRSRSPNRPGNSRRGTTGKVARSVAAAPATGNSSTEDISGAPGVVIADMEGGVGEKDGIAASGGERRSRSISTSGGMRNRVGTGKASQSLPPTAPRTRRNGKTSSQSRGMYGGVGGDDDDGSDDDINGIGEQLAIFKCMPSEIFSTVKPSSNATATATTNTTTTTTTSTSMTKQLKGPMLGLWLAPHPLQLQPASYIDMTMTIQESNISDAKKLEWNLDLIREYDEKRMDRFEAFLVSRRDNSPDVQFQPIATSSRSGTNSMSRVIGGVVGKRRTNSASSGIDDYRADYYRDKGRQAYKSPL